METSDRRSPADPREALFSSPAALEWTLQTHDAQWSERQDDGSCIVDVCRAGLDPVGHVTNALYPLWRKYPRQHIEQRSDGGPVFRL